MTLESDIILELGQPLDPRRVTVGRNGPLNGIKYLEGEDVIRTANRIFGYGGWGFELEGQPWCVEKGEQGNNHTLYEVWAAHGRLSVPKGGSFADVGTCVRQGAGSGGLEMAIKGCVTDAMKRCLRNYGDQFGLILYDKTTDLAGLAADFSGASGIELPPVAPPPALKTAAPPGAAWWPEFRQLKNAKHVTDAAVEQVIGAGPTLPAVQKWLDEHPETNFAQLVGLAEKAQQEQMAGV